MSKQVDPASVDQLAAIKSAREKVRNQRVIVADRGKMLRAAKATLNEYEHAVETLIDEDLPLFNAQEADRDGRK